MDNLKNSQVILNKTSEYNKTSDYKNALNNQIIWFIDSTIWDTELNFRIPSIIFYIFSWVNYISFSSNFLITLVLTNKSIASISKVFLIINSNFATDSSKLLLISSKYVV